METYNPLIQRYSGEITKTKPVNEIKLQQLFWFIKHPPDKLKDLIFAIRHAKKGPRSEFKKKLPTFCPCAYVDGRRRYADISHFTGLLALDYDNLPSVTYSQQFRDALFKEYKCIFGTWLSSSNKGVRAIIKIPQVQSVDEYKAYYRGVLTEFNQYRGMDNSTANPILPMFYSIDENLKSREKPTTWTTKKKKPKPTPKPIIINSDNKGKKAWVIRNAKRSIDRITDVGHPRLLRTSYTVGGYVAGGYISEAEAISLMHDLIDSNSYLSKKASTYKQTAKDAIRSGQSKPLYFNS